MLSSLNVLFFHTHDWLHLDSLLVNGIMISNTALQTHLAPNG